MTEKARAHTPETVRTVWPLLSALMCILFLNGCSTARNTAGTRFYHATTAHYNTYFNGKEAFDKGYASQEQAMKVNWLEYPDLNPAADARTRDIGKSSYQTAIDKAKKSIKFHSISAKPKRKTGKTLTPKEKEWYAKTEYNPFLWNAWMLMADAQAQTGEFIEAASTYSYISELYANEPDIAAVALSRMAWCYAQLDWYYEADELFSRTIGIKTDRQENMGIKALRVQSLLRQERYEECIPLLEDAIFRKGLSKSQRIRERYLLAQLYKTAGRNADAGRCFGQVIRMNPSYDVEFHARIRQTETMAAGQNSRKAMRKLEHMLRDPKNEERRDQIHYAMGNIEMLENDTVSALRYYESGAADNDRSAPDKGILFLTMAGIYWDMADYSNAGRCYSQAVGMIGTGHKDFETVKLRSSILEELGGHLDEVHLQDSLQWLATLPEAEVERIIDNVIELLIQKEEQEEENNNDNMTGSGHAEKEKRTEDGISNPGAWYFYNSGTVERGKAEFQRQWGERKLEDDWRRSNRSVLEQDYPAELQTVTEAGTSIEDTNIESDSIPATFLPDRHTREYYLNMVPYSPEALEKSDRIITGNLFAAGIIFKNDLSEYSLAEEQLWRIINGYPDCIEAGEALYHLFLMYSMTGRKEMADSCTEILKNRYADSQYTIMLTDSDYIDNARYGRHREDSIYGLTYQAFRDGDTAFVMHGCHISETLYPNGLNRPRFMFLHAATQLQRGLPNTFLAELKELVSKYPQEEISLFAGLIAQGVQDGRILQSGSLFSIWEREGIEGQMPDSLKPDFDNDRYQPYLFVLAYPEDGLNENQLLFEMANFNFSNYTMRNFDLAFSKEQGIGMLSVSEFLNFDEAYTYSHKLYSDPDMARKLDGIKILVISRKNLEILLKYYSFNDWQKYYEENFLNIPQFELDGSTLYEELEQEPGTDVHSSPGQTDTEKQQSES